MKQIYTVHYKKDLNKSEFQQHNITVEEIGECPCCHYASSPTYFDGVMFASKANNIPITVFLILYCTRCKNIYIAKYTSETGLDNLKLQFVYPKQYNSSVFSDEINSLSPEFVSIFNQSSEAEHNPNTQGLAGLGYRKSLEFLIKDYLIKLKHQDKEHTSKLELNKCVDKLDADLQDVARACAWIGNDETHYFKQNPDYNIEDLKIFIQYLVSEIDHECIKAKAKKMIKSKK